MIKTDLTATDLFCGAGGSSTGIVGAGVTVRMAANHWPLAVEVHQLNHPTADHDCADISQVDPRRYPATDILWSSPECTNHSVAKGVKRASGQGELFGDALPDEAAQRSRATMWDVPRFVEAMALRGRPYKYVVVENVVDARWWMFWDAWIMAMDLAGYDHHVVYLNSMFAHGRDFLPAPQSRDRLYVVFWQKKLSRPDLDMRPPGWCARCHQVVPAVQTWKKPDVRWGRYRAQYIYLCSRAGCGGQVEPFTLPAAVAIDWSDLGQRIGDRKRPLALATRERVKAGLARYGPHAVGVTVGGNTFERRPGVRTWPSWAPMPVRTGTAGDALATPPLLVPVEGRDGKHARPATEPARTLTGRGETGIAVAEPFLAILRGQSVTQRATDPLSTVSAGGGHHGVVAPEPFITVNRTGSTATRIVEVFQTMVAGTVAHALTVPDGAKPFVPVLRRNGTADGIDEPLATVAAEGHHHALAVPEAFLMRNFTPRGVGAGLSTAVVEPARTITGAGNQSLVEVPDALIQPYYRTAVAQPADEPMPTLTSRDRHALVGLPEVSDADVDTCRFRMLQPGEIAAAMAFPTSYELLGNKGERTRMMGNAVTPPAARLILDRIVASYVGAAG